MYHVVRIVFNINLLTFWLSCSQRDTKEAGGQNILPYDVLQNVVPADVFITVAARGPALGCGNIIHHFSCFVFSP